MIAHDFVVVLCVVVHFINRIYKSVRGSELLIAKGDAVSFVGTHLQEHRFNMGGRMEILLDGDALELDSVVRTLVLERCHDTTRTVLIKMHFEFIIKVTKG